MNLLRESREMQMHIHIYILPTMTLSHGSKYAYSNKRRSEFISNREINTSLPRVRVTSERAKRAVSPATRMPLIYCCFFRLSDEKSEKRNGIRIPHQEAEQFAADGLLSDRLRHATPSVRVRGGTRVLQVNVTSVRPFFFYCVQN